MSGEVITSGVSTIVDVTKAGLGLFTEFPLNLIIIGGLIAMGIGLVRDFIPRKKGSFFVIHYFSHANKLFC